VADTVSFANDIAPILFPYRGQMAWRLDLTRLDDVKANHAIIMGQIATDPPGMPPPPFPPFTPAFVALFKAWKDGGYAA
jgi:hypothetical protein